jgi:hypothetical protein
MAERQPRKAQEARAEAASLYGQAGMKPLVHLAECAWNANAAESAAKQLSVLGIADPIAWARGHGVILRGAQTQSKSAKFSEARR